MQVQYLRADFFLQEGPCSRLSTRIESDDSESDPLRGLRAVLHDVKFRCNMPWFDVVPCGEQASTAAFSDDFAKSFS